MGTGDAVAGNAVAGTPGARVSGAGVHGAGVHGAGVPVTGAGGARRAGGGDDADGAAGDVEELAVGEAGEVSGRTARARREPVVGLVDACEVGGRGARRRARREDGGQGVEVLRQGCRDDGRGEVVVGDEAGAEGAVVGGGGLHFGEGLAGGGGRWGGGRWGGESGRC